MRTTMLPGALEGTSKLVAAQWAGRDIDRMVEESEALTVRRPYVRCAEEIRRGRGETGR